MEWTDIKWHPKQRLLRQFAGLWILFFVVAGLLQLKSGRPMIGRVLLDISVIGVVGLVWPCIMRPLFVGWMVAAFPIGWCVSSLLLALIFFGVFMPIGIFCHLRGRNALRIRKPATRSYLQPKRSPPIDRYYRTF